WRGLGKHAKPTEWIFALEHLDRTCGNAGPAHAVKAIAAGDEIAFNGLLFPIFAIAHLRMSCFEIDGSYILGSINDVGAALSVCVHEVAGKLGLAVNSNVCAQQSLEVDAQTSALESECDAVMHQTFAVQPFPASCCMKHVDRYSLEKPRADSPEHIFARLTFK